jgi:hypothetical protein
MQFILEKGKRVMPKHDRKHMVATDHTQSDSAIEQRKETDEELEERMEALYYFHGRPAHYFSQLFSVAEVVQVKICGDEEGNYRGTVEIDLNCTCFPPTKASMNMSRKNAEKLLRLLSAALSD